MSRYTHCSWLFLFIRLGHHQNNAVLTVFGVQLSHITCFLTSDANNAVTIDSWYVTPLYFLCFTQNCYYIHLANHQLLFQCVQFLIHDTLDTWLG